MRKSIKIWMFALLLAMVIPFLGAKAQAKDLDQIRDYEITVDVNKDGTLNMLYHIEWEVLDSTSEEPLTWVKIGIPNNKYVSMKKLTSNIKKIGYYSASGSYARIDFDKSYRKGDIVKFEFQLVQDYVYQMNQFTEGETVYGFTPGWFNDIKVDKLVIRWNADKAISTEPAAEKISYNNGTYFVWTEENVKKGGKLPVQVTYPNDAFTFDPSKMQIDGDKEGRKTAIFAGVIIAIVALGFVGLIVAAIAYDNTANMKASTKITRTKIV